MFRRMRQSLRQLGLKGVDSLASSLFGRYPISMKKQLAAVVLAGLLVTPLPGRAQQVIQVPGPVVGDLAPDFALPGATRYGLLKNPVRLSDFRGSTVVLAFFYQARTKG